MPDAVLASLRDAVPAGSIIGTTNDPDAVANLRRLTHEAMAVELETPRTYRESVDLFRIGKAEIEANPDGIDFSGAMFDSLAAIGFFTREAALDPTSAAYSQGIDAVMINCDTAMGYVWLVSPTNTRQDQLDAGRDWLRVNLAATRAGTGTQPMSQALQEYPEMDALYAECHDTLAPDGGIVQMLARLGYAPDVPPGPRWPIEAKVIGS